mgnify:FL=1
MFANQNVEKMKPIHAALQELKTTVLTMVVCNALIDSFVIFLLFVLVFILLNIYWYVSLFPFMIYAVIHTLTLVKYTKYEFLEKKLPFLHEQLRTVADNINLDNDVINSLNVDVLRKMREVKTSVFLKFGKISSRIVTLVILSFLIIFTSATNTKFLDTPKFIEDLGKKAPLPFEATEGTSQFLTNETGALYGNKSIAELGYKEVQLYINPVQSDLDISRVKDPEKHDFQSNYAPREIKASVDASLQEDLPKNYYKVVKNYFSQISKE